jgi:hypothetical protein
MSTILYFEKDGVIFRGKEYPGEAPDVGEYIVNGQWKECSSKEGRDAYAWGNPMDEEEARKFQGKDWPAETAPQS